MKKKKFTRLYKVLITFLFEFIYGKINSIENGNKYRQSIKLAGSNKLYHIYNLKNSRLYTDTIHDTAFIKSNKIIDGPSFQFRNLINSDVKNNKVITFNTPRFKRKLSGSTLCILTGGAGNNNYWHWMYDVLPRLAIIQKIYNLKKIDNFLVPDLKYNFQIETLKLLNIYEKSLPSVKYRHIESELLLSTSHPWQFSNSAHDDINKIPKWISLWIRNTFLKKKKFYNSKYNKIYIDRSDSKSNYLNKRKIKNEEEVKYYLKNKGFKILNLSEFKIIDQIKIFNSAKIIVGNHGAGFANVVYCKKNTKVIEFTNKYTAKIVKKVCTDVNLKYFAIQGIQIGQNTKDQNNDIYLPLNKLRNILN